MLVIVQVALSLALLIGAGLLVGTLRNLRIQDVGFNQANLLLIWTAPVRTGRTVPVLADFAKTLEERLVSLPGVLSASVSNGGVLDGSVTSGRSNSETLSFQGQLPKPGLTLRQVAVSPGFLATVGTPLVAGRDFNEMDTDKAPQVAILNETMARFFFGSENPVGQRFSATGESGFPIEVVGVVKDAKLGTPRDRRGAWYFPYRQNSRFLRLNWCVAVRTSGPPSGFATSIRQALHDLDPNLPVLKVTTIEGQLDHVLAQERLMAMLSGFFGVLATLLSALGLYGVMSYTVTRRVSEIGIRLAMGATPQGVLRLVLKESVTLILGGIALGVPFTVAVTRVISTWLFGISPMDPLTMAGVLILVLAVGMLAAFLPAHRASRVDPMTALRCE
jgi:predicted permease